MKMILRWFANGLDTVKLEHIRQIPGISGVATSLMKVPVGEVWPLDEIKKVHRQVIANGLSMEVIESVNIHEDIKLGLSSRDRYIQNYIDTMVHLAEVGVKCICYNFMPVLDWARSELSMDLPDGSQTMAYRHDIFANKTPKDIVNRVNGQSKGFELPGWEAERLEKMAETMEQYATVSEDAFWGNIQYFLNKIIPVAEELDIRMAIHPDDPPWPIFGLHRMINSKEGIRRFLALNPSLNNGITLCTGSLGADTDNDIPGIVSEFAKQGRIHFAHIRNLMFDKGRDFHESAHLSRCGSLDMFAIMKAFYDNGFNGYIRPDHGRMIWGEKARPGYGLYDRALGSNYLLGLWEAIEELSKA